MIKLLIPLILIVLAVILARRYVNAVPADKQKARKIDALLIFLMAGFLILALLHRMHWLGVTVPALVIAIRKLANLIPVIMKKKATSPPPSQSSNMTEDEAMKILGIEKPYNQDDIVEAHRKLISRMHPDRGGNDYLAAKINEAKDVLLKNT